MVAKLIPHGDDYALLLDRATLKSIHVDPDTPLDVSARGGVLVIRGAGGSVTDAELDEILEGVNQDYGTVLRKLAE